MLEWTGHFWNLLIYPEYCVDEVEDPEVNILWVLKGTLKNKIPDFVVCISLDDYDDLSPEARREAITKVKRYIRRFFSGSQCKLLGFAHRNSLYFCGNIPDLPAFKNYSSGQNEVYQRLHLLQSFLKRRSDITVSIGLAFLEEHSIKGWRLAAQRAVVAQRQKVKKGRGSINVYPKDIISEFRDYSNLDNLLEELYNSIYEADIPQVETTTKKLLDALFEERYLPLKELRPTIQFLISTVILSTIRSGIKFSEISSELQGYLTEVETTYDYVRLREILKNVITTFSVRAYRCRKSNSCNLVERAKQFILLHLSEPISLRVISNELNVNPSYLSRVFKKQEGINITTYIHLERIKEAKRLLVDKDYKISTVAFTLGFGSIQHFLRVFKKVEGCSPKEFRKSKLVKYR